MGPNIKVGTPVWQALVLDEATAGFSASMSFPSLFSNFLLVYFQNNKIKPVISVVINILFFIYLK